MTQSLEPLATKRATAKRATAKRAAVERAHAIASRYGALPHVRAVALAGSQTHNVADIASDIDLYVYFRDEEVPLSERKRIAHTDAIEAQVDNRFWEPGDEWIDAPSGLAVDVMFRSCTWIEDQLDRVLVECQASVGYSTCFWDNIRASVCLFDRDGWYGALQERALGPYPDALRRAVVAKNFPILTRTISSYSHQLASAIRRRDSVSVNHRVAAFVASYFDILFAVNRVPHPGEKRLLDLAEAHCPERPANMRAAVTALITASAYPQPAILVQTRELARGLEVLLRNQGLLSEPVEHTEHR